MALKTQRTCLPACAAILPLLLWAPGCGKTASLTEMINPGQGGHPLCLQDPGQEGRQRTAQFDLQVPVSGGIGRLQVTVFGPSDDGMGLSQQGAPYPLVILSPALLVPRSEYFDYAYRLANHGFVVAVQDPNAASDHHQYMEDTMGLLSWLETPTGIGAQQVLGAVDPARVGVGGHGLGGKISFLLAEQDSRARAVFGIDPVDTGGENDPSALPGLPHLQAATGLLGENRSAAVAESCTPAGQNYAAFFSKLPSPSFAIVFTAAGTMDFVDDLDSCVACTGCGSGAADKATVHALAVKYTTAFFQATLQGCTASQTYLSGAEFQKDAASGVVALQSK